MSIAAYEDLLRAAREQTEPQRLLFVFAKAVLPDDSTPEQRTGFAAGRGGVLEPLMSVDKAPEELGSFAELAEESLQFASDWSIVFVSALAAIVAALVPLLRQRRQPIGISPASSCG